MDATQPTSTVDATQPTSTGSLSRLLSGPLEALAIVYHVGSSYDLGKPTKGGCLVMDGMRFRLLLSLTGGACHGDFFGRAFDAVLDP